MIINHNISALNTYRQLTINNSAAAKNLEKLSSGFRINRAGDDAAGLAISEKMRGQIRGLNMAAKNAQDGISLIQTAEGALTETHAILQRMRELAVQAANDTNTNEDRFELQKEVDQLIEELDRIAKNTEFNTQKLLDGSLSGTDDDDLSGTGDDDLSGTGDDDLSGTDDDDDDKALTFHIGANQGQKIELQISDMSASGLGVSGLKINTQTDADNAITKIDNAIKTVSSERAKLGAYQNRLEHTINNLSVAAENLQAAESRIRDVDMAKEMMEFTKNSILQQAATAMLAQANQMPQGVLQLLR